MKLEALGTLANLSSEDQEYYKKLREKKQARVQALADRINSGEYAEEAEAEATGYKQEAFDSMSDEDKEKLAAILKAREAARYGN